MITLTGAAWPDRTIPLGRIRPPFICTKRPGGDIWQHYTRGPDDTYLWLSPCLDIAGHEPPAEMCTKRWGDGEHQCLDMLPHDVHRCCCGDVEGTR